jgi:hypothetical protein
MTDLLAKTVGAPSFILRKINSFSLSKTKISIEEDFRTFYAISSLQK